MVIGDECFEVYRRHQGWLNLVAALHKVKTNRIFLKNLAIPKNSAFFRTLLELQRKGTATVIPIILRDCDWQHEAYAAFQALPPDAKPITLYSNQDTAFRLIAEGIRRLAEGPTKSLEP